MLGAAIDQGADAGEYRCGARQRRFAGLLIPTRASRSTSKGRSDTRYPQVAREIEQGIACDPRAKRWYRGCGSGVRRRGSTKNSPRPSPAPGRPGRIKPDRPGTWPWRGAWGRAPRRSFPPVLTTPICAADRVFFIVDQNAQRLHAAREVIPHRTREHDHRGFGRGCRRRADVGRRANRMGRRYSAPGASGTASRQRLITARTMSASCAASGSGNTNCRALCCIR